jgi:hypothetical protein
MPPPAVSRAPHWIFCKSSIGSHNSAPIIKYFGAAIGARSSVGQCSTTPPNILKVLLVDEAASCACAECTAVNSISIHRCEGVESVVTSSRQFYSVSMFGVFTAVAFVTLCHQHLSCLHLQARGSGTSIAECPCCSLQQLVRGGRCRFLCSHGQTMLLAALGPTLPAYTVMACA